MSQRKKFPHTAEVVRTHREKTPWSQAELAATLGLSGQAISNIERGLAGVPIKRAQALASKIELPIEVLKEAMLKDLAHTIDLSFAKSGLII